MNERHIEVPRTARYYVLGPGGPGGPGGLGGPGGARGHAGPAGDRTRRLWVACHGFRQLAGRFIRRFEGLERDGLTIVAPEALSRFYLEPGERRHGAEDGVGATWMTRAHRDAEIRDYVRYLDRVTAEVVDGEPTAATEVTALGFSQGGHTVARWTVLGATPVRRLILWGSHLPEDLDWGAAAPVLKEVDLIFVDGDTDPMRESRVRLGQEDILRRWGVPFTVLTHPGGHALDTELLRELAGQ